MRPLFPPHIMSSTINIVSIPFRPGISGCIMWFAVLWLVREVPWGLYE